MKKNYISLLKLNTLKHIYHEKISTFFKYAYIVMFT